MRIIFFFLLPCVLFSLERKEIQDMVREHVQPSIGLVLGVIDGDQTFTYSFGNLSHTSTIPVNRYTEFRIGHLTKLFTASLLAKFVHEDKVSFHDPITKFIPRSLKVPRYQGREITLLDLATHTSGLPDIPYELKQENAFDTAQLFRFLSSYELKRAPGEKYEHSNLGYALLSNLLSRIGKQNFPALLESKLLHPLNLDETTVNLSKLQKRRQAKGYAHGQMINMSRNERLSSAFIGSGGIYSTVEDMMKWLSFHLGRKGSPKLLSILPLMQKPYFQVNGDLSIGLGWEITHGGDFFRMSGTQSGFSSFISFSKKRNVGIVILSNSSECAVDVLGTSFLNRL